MTISSPAQCNWRLLACAAFVLVTAVPAFAGSGSWVFLQDNTEESLVRLSADGRSITPIAKGTGGVGLAIDAAGNYNVGAHTALLRVTRAGVVSQIAAAPVGSSWTKVAVDAAGNIIVADGFKPAVWRVTADGASVVEIASYREFDCDLTAERSLALTIDTSGDYLLLADGIWYPPGMNRQIPEGTGPEYFFRITPQGRITKVPLKGVKLNQVASMVPDGKGSYLITGRMVDNGILRLTPDGLVTRVPGFERDRVINAIARNPETGALIAVFSPYIFSSPGEGEPFTLSGLHLGSPTAVVWDPGQ